MTTQPHSTQPHPTIAHKPDPLRSIGSLYKALLRSQYKVGRIVGLAALGLAMIPLALVTNNATDPKDAGTNMVAQYGLAVVLPVVAALIATNVLANLIEDNLLVYLWMKPTPKWHLATAAWAVTVTALIPLVVVPIAIGAALIDGGGVVGGALISGVLGALAYAGFFTAVSAQFRRALWVALGYILVWENLISAFSDNTARLSIRSYVFSYLEDATNVDLNLADRSAWLAVVVPLAVAAAGVAIAGWRLATRDVA